ncbi:Kiwa anti-phage protein KwaB-like domain-containing protein [Umezakia ovalisporum]|uniref:DUF4868 domain-containing protein n=1 Tax=Umezakia ovalisporum FSS-43 TaxID=2740520 RepID=A0ABT6K2B4_9CYAN|nr:Kiwa anti-phage protein KwaB-like domain-containing protein [Umezakia ovalisporum]MDH6056130.1 DUF4868 domain-containing protein [Umezakia ovalisporum FSS-43]
MNPEKLLQNQNTLKLKFRELKNASRLELSAQLVMVKYSTNRDRTRTYSLKYVPTTEKLEKRLKSVVLKKVEESNDYQDYSLDSLEPEEDGILGLDYSETDFFAIFKQLQTIDPETDVITGVEELELSKSYLIVLRNIDGIQLVGYKALPENWKIKGKKNLLSLLFKDNQFTDVEEGQIFSISKTVDSIYFQETMFILSKKDFERGLNFREGMKANTQNFYNEVQDIGLFVNLNLLSQKVGDNLRLMRKVAQVRNLGHYKNQHFLSKLQAYCGSPGWEDLCFNGGQIVLDDSNIEGVLNALADKRLLSELTQTHYEVDSAKKLQFKR